MSKNEGTSISFFLPSFEIGGAERNTLKLLSSLVAKSYSLSLVLSEKKGGFIESVPDEVAIVDLKARGYMSTLIELVKYLRNNHPDILVSAFPHFNIICLIARKLSKVKTKVVITEHTPFSLLPTTARNLFNKLVVILFIPCLIKIFYPGADAVICVSEGVAKDILRIVFLNRLKVIHNPIVDDDLFDLSNQQVNHKWLNGGNVPVIVAVGRLAKAKDYPTLFEAIKIILRKKNVYFIILGNGPEELKLKKMVESMGLSENIDFLGFCSNPYKYIKKSSVYVLSSMQEGFGNTIVEAMACAKPVVSTNCPSGPAEIIEDGKNGILVPVANPEALAKAILRVLDDHLLSENLSKEGLKRSEYFSVKKSVAEYEKVFKEII